MEATAHKRLMVGCQALLGLLFLAVTPVRADQSADILATVNHVATALSNDDAADAMTAFDKSFSDYSKLSDYFEALVNRGLLVNEVNVLDEQDSEKESVLSVEWALTITAKGFGGDTERRVQQVRIRLRPGKNGKWEIFEFSPISLFDPERQTNSKK